MGLLFALPLSCGKSNHGDDDDDAGSDQGGAGDGGKGGASGAKGGSANGGSNGGASSGGAAVSGSGGASAGNGGTAGVFTLPGGGRSFASGGRAGSGGASGGAGASAGKGGASVGGTGGTAGASTVAGVLGSGCTKDADCDDPTLHCVLSSDLSDDSGPPRGLCTKACSTNNDCAGDGAAYCFAFTDQDQYCVEACTTGTLGSPKCHSRDDFACSLVGLASTGASCETNTDCGATELCDPSTLRCGASVTGCVPLCAGDFQCGSGQYCDFSTGLCVSTAPTRLPIGSACTAPQGGAADPCQGFCDIGSDGVHGACEALCTLQQSLVGCGWDGTGTPDNVCLFGTILSPPGDAAVGDVGICGALCDCNADCVKNGDYCFDETGGDVEAIWNRKGYCRPLSTGESQGDTFTSCATGAGGQAGAGG